MISAEFAQTQNQTAPVEAIQNRVRGKLYSDEWLKSSPRAKGMNPWRWVGNEELQAPVMAVWALDRFEHKQPNGC